jgi:hypothetical protein
VYIRIKSKLHGEPKLILAPHPISAAHNRIELRRDSTKDE